jgi:hypothetical protein
MEAEAKKGFPEEKNGSWRWAFTRTFLFMHIAPS